MEAPFRLRLSLTIQGYKVHLLLQDDEARGGCLELLIESIDRGKEGRDACNKVASALER